MIDKKEIMPYNFFDYNGVYSGEHNGMRYRLWRTGEKPDYKLTASVWQGPFAYGAVKPSKRTNKEFEFTEAGRDEAIDWLMTQYEKRRTEWDNAPSILEAEIDVNSIYSSN